MIASVEQRQPILILGMHRSGTSALAGVLQALGVYLGQDLIPAIPGINDKGFFEHAGVVKLHEEMLDALGYSWHDVRPLPDNWWKSEGIAKYRCELRRLLVNDFSGTPFWGVKDPRLCRLLPIWLDVFKEIGCTPKFILISRSPQEVALSLNSRDGIDHVASNIMWLFHSLGAYRWTSGYSRSFVKYGELLCDWKCVVSRIQEDLDISWPKFNVLSCEEIDAFLEFSMRHHTDNSDSNSTDNELASFASQLYACDLDNTELVYSIENKFLNEIGKIKNILPAINKTQKLEFSNNSLKRHIAAEKANAKAQVEYRDELIAEIRPQLAAEKANAKAQAEYRDELIAEIRQQLAAEKANAKAQAEYRDELIAETRQQLAAEKANAKAQVEYRDESIAEIRQQLAAEKANADNLLSEFDAVMNSPKLLSKRLISLLGKGLH